MEDKTLGLILIGFIWVLNFAISIWNAYVTGKMWPYTRQIGGWQHFMTWMGYIMSAAGLAWCFLIPLALVAYSQHWYGFDVRALEACLNLGYIVIAPTIVFAGLFIWLDSLANAWRERTLGSVAVGGWNTFAQLHNMWQLFQNMGPAIDNVGDFFKGGSRSDTSSDDAKLKLTILVVVLVVVALLGGIIVATAIVIRTARNEMRQFKREIEERLPEKMPLEATSNHRIYTRQRVRR